MEDDDIVSGILASEVVERDREGGGREEDTGTVDEVEVTGGEIGVEELGGHVPGQGAEGKEEEEGEERQRSHEERRRGKGTAMLLKDEQVVTGQCGNRLRELVRKALTIEKSLIEQCGRLRVVSCVNDIKFYCIFS